MPLANITGALFIQDGWPEAHRRSLPPRDAGEVEWLPHGRYWFIRSPWPSIPLEDLFDLVLREVDEARDSWRPIQSSHDLAAGTVRDLLASDEAAIRRRLTG